MKNIMRNSFLFLCLFLTCLKSNSQIPVGYQEYVSNINNAELSAIDHNYNKALKYYEDAFVYQNVFGKDYYNAAVCAVYEKKHSLAIKYIKLVIAKGYALDSIKTSAVFRDFFTNQDFEVLNRVPVNEYDKDLKIELDSMTFYDQFFRKKDPRNYMHSVYADTVRAIDSMNVIKLKKIINSNGFPSEFQIGLEPGNLFFYKWFLIIMHQGNGSPTFFYNFSKLILVAMQKGDIWSHFGLYLYTRSCGIDSLFGSGSIFKITNGKNVKYSYMAFDKGVEEKYNLNRRQYGLESLGDYRKKFIYWVSHKDLKFDFWATTIESEVIERFPDNFKNLKELK